MVLRFTLAAVPVIGIGAPTRADIRDQHATILLLTGVANPLDEASVVKSAD